IVNQVAKMHHRSGGRVALPIVLRIPYGGGIGAVEHHSESPESHLCHTPGLKVVTCATAQDAYVMIQQAVASDDPVVFLEPKRRYWDRGEVEPDGDPAAAYPLHASRVVRPGSDVTVVAYGPMVRTALEAATAAEADGRDLEVVDLRTLAPLDLDAVAETVRRTRRCMVGHEAPHTLGLGAEIAARLAEDCFYRLEAPVVRVAGYDVPSRPPGWRSTTSRTWTGSSTRWRTRGESAFGGACGRRFHRSRGHGSADGAQPRPGRGTAGGVEPHRGAHRTAAPGRGAGRGEPGRGVRAGTRGRRHARQRRGDRRRARSRRGGLPGQPLRPYARPHGNDLTRLLPGARGGRACRRWPLRGGAGVGVTRAGRGGAAGRDGRRRAGSGGDGAAAAAADVPRGGRLRPGALRPADQAVGQPVPHHDGHRPGRGLPLRPAARPGPAPVAAGARQRPHGQQRVPRQAAQADHR